MARERRPPRERRAAVAVCRCCPTSLSLPSSPFLTLPLFALFFVFFSFLCFFFFTPVLAADNAARPTASASSGKRFFRFGKLKVANEARGDS